MKIGYKHYFMSEKTKKNVTYLSIFFFSYHPILDLATQTSVFYLCKILARGTEPHTHRLWSTSFPLVVT